MLQYLVTQGNYKEIATIFLYNQILGVQITVLFNKFLIHSNLCRVQTISYMAKITKPQIL